MFIEATRKSWDDKQEVILVNMTHVVSVEPLANDEGCRLFTIMDKEESRFYFDVAEDQATIQKKLEFAQGRAMY